MNGAERKKNGVQQEQCNAHISVENRRGLVGSKIIELIINVVKWRIFYHHYNFFACAV